VPKLLDTPVGKLLGMDLVSALKQGFALVHGNPNLIETFIREAYNNLIGVPFHRRFFPGCSSLPTEITLDLTRRCNLNCVMCTQIRHTNDIPSELSWYDKKREMPLSEWISVLDQIASFRPRLHITGGEPFLYSGVEELISEAKKRGLFVRLTSNGTLLAGVSDLLVSKGVEVMAVSVDGPAEVHDGIRGQRGAFRRTADGIRSLQEARRRLGKRIPLIVLISTISKGNLDSLEDIVPMALDLGVDVLEVHHTFFNSRSNIDKHNRIFASQASARNLKLLLPVISDIEYYESEIGREDLERIREGVNTMRRQARGRLNVIFVPNIPDELIDPYYMDLDYPFPQICKRLWKSCRIYPDGSLAPCLHVAIGNITEQGFREIWNSRKMRDFRLTVDRGLFPACARCCSRRYA